MKPIINGLKSKSTVVIDNDESSQSEIDSDIEQIYDVDAVEPMPIPQQSQAHHPKFTKITSIRKINEKPMWRARPNKSGKVEQIQIYDESSNNLDSMMEDESLMVPVPRTEKRQVLRKRLMKVSNKCKIEGKGYSSTECSICLSSLETKTEDEIGRLKCKHAFCLDCIVQSSKFSNRCPYCRSPYFQIDHNNTQIEVQQKNQSQNDDPYDEPCYVCGRNDDFDHLLQCEYCQAAFCHTYCDNRLESQVPPQGSWYCLSCSGLLGE